MSRMTVRAPYNNNELEVEAIEYISMSVGFHLIFVGYTEGFQPSFWGGLGLIGFLLVNKYIFGIKREVSDSRKNRKVED